MDISFKSENEKFNYRVCAMMISDDKVLTMRGHLIIICLAEE